MNSKLTYLIIHCTATPEGRAVSKEDITRWHTSPVSQGGRGWSRSGYADLVTLDGQLVNILPFNTDDNVDAWEISNGATGMNGNSRHIVYAGGMDAQNKSPKDTRSKAQKETLELYVKFTIKRHPGILVLGHNEAPNAKGKACPSFQVPEWLRSIGIPDANIFSFATAAKKDGLVSANTNPNSDTNQEA